MLTRRMVCAGLLALPAQAQDDAFAALEGNGRLGIAVRDTASGRTLSHRASERFAMCSTFKLMLAAAVLKAVDAGTEIADRTLYYGQSALVPYSPVTGQHAALTIGALMEAILIYSDNTAANLLLQTIGGPQGWTAFARSLGDNESRLDRIEPDLNSAIPGDPRDTTTPEAVLQNLQKVLVGEVLSAASRQWLINTMAQSATGAHRLKAGLPPDWRIASKTGSGEHGTRNDIGIVFPPGRAPLLVCAYFTGSTAPDADKERVLAGVGRLVAAL